MDQPGVAGGDDAFPGQFAADPGHFGSGEVGVQRQSGEVLQLIFVRGEFLTEPLGPPVLPDDRFGERFPGVRVPGEHRLALIGEPDGDDGFAGLGQGLRPGVEDRPEQFSGVRLDGSPGPVPRAHRSGTGTDHAPLGADHERLRPRGALVHGEYRACHRVSSGTQALRLERNRDLRSPDPRLVQPSDYVKHRKTYARDFPSILNLRFVYVT